MRREAGEEGVAVVADGVVRGNELRERPQYREGGAEVLQRQQRDRVAAKVVERLEDLAGEVVQRRGAPQDGRAGLERRVDRAEVVVKRRDGRAEVLGERREVGKEGTLGGQAVGPDLQRR